MRGRRRRRTAIIRSAAARRSGPSTGNCETLARAPPHPGPYGIRSHGDRRSNPARLPVTNDCESVGGRDRPRSVIGTPDAIRERCAGGWPPVAGRQRRRGGRCGAVRRRMAARRPAPEWRGSPRPSAARPAAAPATPLLVSMAGRIGMSLPSLSSDRTDGRPIRPRRRQSA